MTRRVYQARWVLPMDGPPVRDGAVAVTGSRIDWVGPAGAAPQGVVVDLGSSVLMPGLVNVHSHCELTAMRGFLEGHDFRRWILRLTHARQEVMTPERRRASARVGIAEGLLAGITTFGDVSDGPIAFEAMCDLGVRGVAYHEVFGPDPSIADDAMRELERTVDTMRARQSDLVRVGISPHAPYTVSDQLFRLVADWSMRERLPVTVHVAEGRDEVALVTRAEGAFAEGWRKRGIAVTPRASSPVALLDATGMLHAGVLLVHMVHATEQDLDRVRTAGCAIAHCPASNAKLGHGIAPVTAMLDRGIPVGLGSDSVASSNRMDLLDEGRLATLQQRAHLARPDLLPAGQVLDMATAGGAAALGLSDRVGSLRPGMEADLVAFPLTGVRDTPSQSPADALLFGAAGRYPVLVTVAGRELVRDGALLFDVRSDLAVVAETAQALSDVPAH